MPLCVHPHVSQRDGRLGESCPSPRGGFIGEGWTRIERLQHWKTLIGSALRPSLALPGKDPFGKEARQLSLQNSFTPAPARVWLNRLDSWIAHPLKVDSASIHRSSQVWSGEHLPETDQPVSRLWISFFGRSLPRRWNLSIRGSGPPLELEGTRSVPPPALNMLPRHKRPPLPLHW